MAPIDGSVAGPFDAAPLASGTTQLVSIALGDRSYDIHIGSGLLDAPASWAGLPASSDALIVCNTTVAPLYAQRLTAAIGRHHHRVLQVDLPDGEQYKSAATLELIYDRLLAESCDRKTVLYALGGGVVGDMTGFAAACYMRGVAYVQVPTTLLAQVDSSVGGKTAINHPLGKNMIGVFNQPLLVVADIETLASLPQRELVAGLAEIIKYGPIADETFMVWTECNLDALWRGIQRYLPTQSNARARSRRKWCHKTSVKRGCVQFSTSVTPLVMRSKRAWGSAPGCMARLLAAGW